MSKEQAPAEEWVPAAEAEAIAGMTGRGLRKRVARGVLARRVDRQGRVFYLRSDLEALQRDLVPADGEEEAAAGSVEEGRNVCAACSSARERSLELLVASRERELSHLLEEVAWVRERLRVSEQSSSELRRLLLAYAPPPSALPPAVEVSRSEERASPSSFWQRLLGRKVS